MGGATTCSNPKCSCAACACGDDCRCNGGRSLGDLERRVMDVVWEDPVRAFTVREVVDVLGDYAYTTVATVLDRLAHKGFVTRRPAGRTLRFVATETPNDYGAMRMREAMEAAADPDAALVRFAARISDAEAVALRRALDERGLPARQR